MTKKDKPDGDLPDRVFETLSEIIPGKFGFASSGIDPDTGEPVTNVDMPQDATPVAPEASARVRSAFSVDAAPESEEPEMPLEDLRAAVERELDPEQQGFLEIQLVRRLIDRGGADDLAEAKKLCGALVDREFVGQTAQRLLRTIRRAQGFSR